MKVQDLRPGTTFRILRKTYRLLRLSPGAALVEVEVKGEEDKVTRHRWHIAPGAEVDEVTGNVVVEVRLPSRKRHEEIIDQTLLERVKKKRAAKKAAGQHLSKRTRKMA